ncbi:MAG TPA: complement resistance protein TraT [bacterium]|jgi:outer membrane lipoprotein SlyB|nr:complement resistance protein TraT [bacterium]
MKSSFLRVGGTFSLLLAVWIAAGCATMGPPEPVDVRTRMSQSVFLDLSNQAAKTVFIRCRDSSDTDSMAGADMEDALRYKLRAEGYTILSSPQGAFYVIQANIRYVGERDNADMGAVLGAGFGGAVIGTMVGGRNGTGLGLLAGLVAGSMAARDVTYILVTDVQITENDANYDQFRTRVVSYAGQMNLEFSRAEPALVDRQSSALAAIF